MSIWTVQDGGESHSCQRLLSYDSFNRCPLLESFPKQACNKLAMRQKESTEKLVWKCLEYCMTVSILFGCTSCNNLAQEASETYSFFSFFKPWFYVTCASRSVLMSSRHFLFDTSSNTFVQAQAKGKHRLLELGGHVRHFKKT